MLGLLGGHDDRDIVVLRRCWETVESLGEVAVVVLSCVREALPVLPSVLRRPE